MKHDELKPCPFCGGEVSITKCGTEWGGYYYHVIREETKNGCTCRLFMESDCVIDGIRDEQKVLDALVKRWNTRTEVEN